VWTQKTSYAKGSNAILHWFRGIRKDIQVRTHATQWMASPNTYLDFNLANASFTRGAKIESGASFKYA